MFRGPSLPPVLVHGLRQASVSTTTTTLFTAPTLLGPHTADKAPVPVAAIVGGSCAGILLAVTAVLAWRWWGRQIRRQQTLVLEKRSALQAAIAYKRSVITGDKSPSATSTLSGTRRSRSRPPSARPQSDRKVKFAATPEPTHVISSPKLLGAKGHANLPVDAPAPFASSRSPRRVQASLLAGSTRNLHPLLPFHKGVNRPFAQSPSGSPAPVYQDYSVTAGRPNGRGRTEELPDKDTGKGTVERFLRTEASTHSLTANTQRLLRTSRSSGSEYSSHSSAESAAQRWSWRALISGPGFSFSQIGIGNGKNRLSADTSSSKSWSDENPTAPVGYAYDGVEEERFAYHNQTAEGGSIAE